MFKDRRVLVTGGAGFIGANLIQRLLSLGARLRSTLHEKPPVIHDERIEYLKADLTLREDCLRAVRGMDYVFMAAANTSGAAVMTKSPLTHVTPNVVMNAQMLEAAHSAGVKKFLFISSSAAYPFTGERPVREEEMFEGDPPEVYYSVGWMKRYSEILCRIYAEKIKNPMPVVVVRPSNVYGPYDKFDPETSHVTASLIRRTAVRENPMEIWGTGEEVRDLIYIDDFLDGMLLAFEKEDPYRVVNIASGEARSVREILETILTVDNYHAEIRFNPKAPQTLPIRLVDITRAKECLGFEVKTSLREGIRKTLFWYKSNLGIAMSVKTHGG